MWGDLWKYTIESEIKIQNFTAPLIQAILEKREKEFMESKEYIAAVNEVNRFKLAPLSYLCKDYIEDFDDHEEKLQKINE